MLIFNIHRFPLLCKRNSSIFLQTLILRVRIWVSKEEKHFSTRTSPSMHWENYSLILFLPLSLQYQHGIRYILSLYLFTFCFLLPQGSFQRSNPVQGRWDQPRVCCQDNPLPGRAETVGAEGIPAAEEASSPPPGAAAHCLHHLLLLGVSGGALSWQGAALQSGNEVKEGFKS